jgi:type II restriction enzyme
MFNIDNYNLEGMIYMKSLIDSYKKDTESVYHTWFFHSNDRLKAFRTIRKGLLKVISEIEEDTFGNDFKGSSLEMVVTAISEQKQVFAGAAHAFYWKPKLRTPDIYENNHNKKAFGRFLRACLETTSAEKVIEEIRILDSLKIKGLGPAVANILYFLHPTLFPPFNTAIVNGYNLLFSERLILGSWEVYLEMRDKMLIENELNRNYLSKDLGALAGLLFEIGSNRMIIDKNAMNFLNKETEKIEKAKTRRRKAVKDDENEENTHSEMQYHLARLGNSLGYKVWIARNDHKREWNGQKLGEFSIKNLNIFNFPPTVADTIALIDVLWLAQNDQVVAGFEVEKSTSIYSGILRLTDLSLSIQSEQCQFYLVAPEKREKEIQAQLLRPSIRSLDSQSISYLLFHDLRCDCDAMCKFGNDISILNKISRII